VYDGGPNSTSPDFTGYTPTKEDTLIDTWWMDSISYWFNDTIDDGFGTYITNPWFLTEERDRTLTFNINYTYSEDSSGTTLTSGTWYLEEDTLTLTDSLSNSFKYVIAFSDGGLSLTVVDYYQENIVNYVVIDSNIMEPYYTLYYPTYDSYYLTSWGYSIIYLSR
jgi:hypothetical protein